MSIKTRPQIRGFIKRWFSDNTTDEGALLTLLRDITDSTSVSDAPIVITEDTTLSLEHLGRNLLVQAAATLTLPEVDTEDLPDGFYCNVKRSTSNVVDFSAEGTDVIDSVGDATAIANENGWVTVHKDSDGIYSLIGDV